MRKENFKALINGSFRIVSVDFGFGTTASGTGNASGTLRLSATKLNTQRLPSALLGLTLPTTRRGG